MKTSKEFFDKLRNDEEFAKEIAAKVKEKIDAGEQDAAAIWIPIAAECGYELTGEELNEMVAKAQGELSDEELGKVAGGTTPLAFISIVYTITTATYVTVKTFKD